jgi:hypothetical protein
MQFTLAFENFHGEINSIPADIQKQMMHRTWHEGCPIGFNKLAYLHLSYWGFDNKVHVGELIVYKPLAQETLNIFRQLFIQRFPIEKMRLPERYANDEAQAAANNSSAFYCRADGQTPTKFSHHSYGIAVDINPLYNPAIEGKTVSPVNGRPYLNRKLKQEGMINEGDKVFSLFTKHGWLWGGFFTEVDYMHFEKFMTLHYMINGMGYIPPDQRIKSMNEL